MKREQRRSGLRIILSSKWLDWPPRLLIWKGMRNEGGIWKKSDWGIHPLKEQSIQAHRPLVNNTWSNFFSKEVVGRNITLWSVLFRITTQAFQCNLYSLPAFWFYITFHESLPLIFNLLTCTTLLWIDTWGPLLHRGIDVWSRFHLCIKYPQPKAMKLPWKTI